MSTARVSITEEGAFIECSHCLVYSIKLSKDEYIAVCAGQQMIEVCQACGHEVVIDV